MKNITLKKRTPEESRVYLMTQITQLIADRRDLLNASKRVIRWLGDYPNCKGRSLEDAYSELSKCIQRIEGKS